jgi:hypothetical protein
MAKQDVRSAWRALLACGFDFFFERWVDSRFLWVDK